MQMNQYRKIATPEPALSSEILPLHGACPEQNEILRYAQNDKKRRIQGQNDSK